MINGFYDTKSLKSKAKRKKFLLDAFMLSYHTVCETKYNKDNVEYSRREMNTKYTPQQILNIGGKLEVIDRNLYNAASGAPELDGTGEIALHTKEWEFLYIFLTIENLDILVEKYNLKLINW